MDALFTIAEIIVAPFSAIALKARLFSALVRVEVERPVETQKPSHLPPVT